MENQDIFRAPLHPPPQESLKLAIDDHELAHYCRSIGNESQPENIPAPRLLVSSTGL